MSARQHSARCTGRWEWTEQGWCTHSIVCTVWFTLSASARATKPSGPILVKRKLEEIEDQVSGGACREGQRETVHRVSTPTLSRLHRAMGADRARVARSPDRVHRLVHLERFGQSNSSLGTDLGPTQAGGKRETVHRVSTPTLCTLHRAVGADGARLVHSLDRVHRLVHLERLGESNKTLGPDLVAIQAGRKSKIK
jgi:hypothetical protein